MICGESDNDKIYLLLIFAINDFVIIYFIKTLKIKNNGELTNCRMNKTILKLSISSNVICCKNIDNGKTILLTMNDINSEYIFDYDDLIDSPLTLPIDNHYTVLSKLSQCHNIDGIMSNYIYDPINEKLYPYMDFKNTSTLMFLNDSDSDLKQMIVLDLSSQQEHEVEEQKKKKCAKSISLPLDNVDNCIIYRNVILNGTTNTTIITTIITSEIACNLIVLLNLLCQRCIWRCQDGIIIAPKLSHMILVMIVYERQRSTKSGCGVHDNDDGFMQKLGRIDNKASESATDKTIKLENMNTPVIVNHDRRESTTVAINNDDPQIPAFLLAVYVAKQTMVVINMHGAQSIMGKETFQRLCV